MVSLMWGRSSEPDTRGGGPTPETEELRRYQRCLQNGPSDRRKQCEGLSPLQDGFEASHLPILPS